MMQLVVLLLPSLTSASECNCLEEAQALRSTLDAKYAQKFEQMEVRYEKLEEHFAQMEVRYGKLEVKQLLRWFGISTFLAQPMVITLDHQKNSFRALFD